MSDPIRLAKQLTQSTQYSRREAELLIRDGWVTVNGDIIDLPQHLVSESDTIELSPDAQLIPSDPVTIVLHKPIGFRARRPQTGEQTHGANENESDEAPELASELLTEHQQIENDRSPLRWHSKHLRQLQLVHDLEDEATGLLVFTQDKQLVKRIKSSPSGPEHEYVVGVEGEIIENGLELLNNETHVNGKSISRIKISWQTETSLRIAVKGLGLGDIATLCEQVNLTVTFIRRLRIGRISLSKLPIGEWRYVLPNERF